MIPAQLATLGVLKIKVFWNKGYDIIISAHYIRSKILFGDSNYIADFVMWTKFVNPSISMRKVIVTSVLQGFDRKKQLRGALSSSLRGALSSSSIIWN